MSFEEFIEYAELEAKKNYAMIEDLITESTNPVMLLDKVYRCQDRFIRSYKYETKVFINTVTHLLEKRIDGYSYDDVVQEVMSLYKER